MTTSDAGDTTARAAWRPLEARERRVLGVLIEKAKTTPAAYPMSVNAIVTGCNQKNNRDPVMALEELEVERAIETLRADRAVSEIDWLGRVSKFKHHAYEWLGVSKAELAIMAELLLRGAQTLGELRTRAARMEPIADLAALKPLVDALIARGLMIALTPPGRGQVVSHNLYLPPELAEVRARHGGPATGAARAPDRAAVAGPPASSAPAAGPAAATDALQAELAALRDEVARLRRRVEEFEARIGRTGD